MLHDSDTLLRGQNTRHLFLSRDRNDWNYTHLKTQMLSMLTKNPFMKERIETPPCRVEPMLWDYDHIYVEWEDPSPAVARDIGVEGLRVLTKDLEQSTFLKYLEAAQSGFASWSAWIKVSFSAPPYLT